MKTAQKIINYIEAHKEASAKELSTYLQISDRAVFKQLSKLLTLGLLEKVGTSPKVFYKISYSNKNSDKEHTFDKKTDKLINDNFLYITPLGEYHEGTKGFIKWCNERDLNVELQAKQYLKIITDINQSKTNGIINATEKFESTFENNFLNGVYYVDFYSIPQFGKTKLGQLLLYAKQSQDKARIRTISEIAHPVINKLVKAKKIDAIGFIPPTIKREVQFMRELENNLNLKLPILKISKIRTDIIIPQKTLSKLSDRIANAMNTIIVEDKREFKNILLIDDAAGSGATFNETARKIKNRLPKCNVYCLAITGSYKGYDVISEV